MKIFLISLLVLFIYCDSMGQSPYVINFSFETADRTDGGKINYNSTGLACYPYCMALQTRFARSGVQGIQSLLYSTDSCFQGSRRCEGQIIKSGADSSVPNKYYAISIYPEIFPYALQQGIVMQLYTETHGIAPAVAIWAVPDGSGLFMNWALNIKYDTTQPLTTLTQKQYILGRCLPNQWTDFALEVSWKSDYTGYVDVYIGSPGVKGTKVNLMNGHTYTGATMSAQFNPAQPRYPTFRFGEYWFSWHAGGIYAINERLCDYDNLKIGNADMPLDSFLYPSTPVPPLNLPPIANAGANTIVTLPANGALNGSASSDPDGTIASSLWTHVSAGTATITTPASLTSTVTGLSAGVHQFQLRVTDNKGLKDSSLVTITVFAAPPVNIPPTANAGPNSTVVLPATVATLNGSGSTDPDGTIVSYKWSLQSGTGTYSINSPSTAITSVTNLQQGRYVFVLTVTDNNGATNSSTVEITVIPDTSLPLKLKVKI